MSWDSKYVNFGVLKIDGTRVKVYYSKVNYTTINCNKDVINASWAGGELNITLADGKVRRYSNKINYQTI